MVDADGREGQESLRQLGVTTPPTVITGSGGMHHYFRYPGFEVRNFTGKLPGLDFRGDGGYVICPPSLHLSGNRYAWGPEGPPDFNSLPTPPDSVRALCRNRATCSGTDGEVLNNWPDANHLASVLMALESSGHQYPNSN